MTSQIESVLNFVLDSIAYPDVRRYFHVFPMSDKCWLYSHAKNAKDVRSRVFYRIKANIKNCRILSLAFSIKISQDTN